MKIQYRRLIWLLLLAAGTIHAQEPVQPAAHTLQQAEALIERGKSDEAYALLVPLEPELAGNTDYDYLLGISAVNSGRASLAVFAFERVQAADPGYKDNGLWLSIAYYQSGDRQRAKSGFEGVISQSASAEARGKAEHYLAVIRKEETGRTNQPALAGHVEFGIGHDSNITNNSLAYLGALQLAGTVPAPPSHQGGMESILNLGVEGRVPLSGYFAFASVDDDKRLYRANSVMNSDSLVAKGGVDFASNGDMYRVSASRRQFSQQGTAFSITGNTNDYTMSGAEGRARFRLSAQDYLGLVAQYNQLRFLAINAEDTNQVLLGVNYLHQFQSEAKPVLYFGYARLDDRAVRAKNSLNPAVNGGLTVASRYTDIFTLYLQYAVNKDVDIVSTDYVYFRRDTGAFARDAAIDYGKDKTSFLSLGVNWRPRAQWTIRSQLAKTSNYSNIDLYSYSKVEATVILRRDFN